jgi:hypothetical protein
MGGRLYFELPLGHSGGQRASSAGYVCVDLRTSEIIWKSDKIGNIQGFLGTYPGTLRPEMKANSLITSQ